MLNWKNIQEFLNEKTLNLELEIEEKQKELYKLKEKLGDLSKTS